MNVVVLHGFTGSGAAMRELAEHIGGASVLPDLAGHGAGPHPGDDLAYTVDGMAAAVADLIDDTGPAHLVGYSMGGRVALALACRRPELVASLSLIGASPGIADEADRAARAAADDALAETITPEAFEAFVDQWMANPLFATQGRLGSVYLAASRMQRLANDPAGLARSLRHGSTGRMAPLHADLARLVMPVALIVGADDPKFRTVAAKMADLVPSATVHVIPRAGHATHVEQPAATAVAIRATMDAA